MKMIERLIKNLTPEQRKFEAEENIARLENAYPGLDKVSKKRAEKTISMWKEKLAELEQKAEK